MQLTIRSYWQKISNHVSERHPLVYKVTSYNSSYYKKSMHLHLGFVWPQWCAVVLCFHCVWWQVTQWSCSLVVPLTAVLSFLPWHSRSPVTNHSYSHTTESKQALSTKNEGKQVATVHKHTHPHPFNGSLSGTTWVSQYQKGKTIRILLKQEAVSGSGICKSVPCSRQITILAPHHSVFYRPDALPATQPTASKHWRPK